MGNNPSHFKGEKNLPVEMVSWDDCQEFIKKLRQKDKKPYRLPTEAEWEYSCRAGTTTRFHFGDDISPEQANYAGGIPGPQGRFPIDGKNFRGKTTPVGSFPANAWGLHDMHGNVCQLCQDWYGDYPEKNVVDPQGPETGKSRVRRGGSWSMPSVLVTAFTRAQEVPSFRSRFTGFRVCFFEE
jgi:formylglycine-generating enzyme required for sulfatase activity